MPRISVTLSELAYLRLREYAQNEAGETMSRAAAEIIWQALAQEDELLDLAQDNPWGRPSSETLDTPDHGTVTACPRCGWVSWDNAENCPHCEVPNQHMPHAQSVAIKVKTLDV